MNCKICSRKYDLIDLKPLILYPCCHILCIKCLTGLNECPICSQAISNKKLSHDLINVIEERKQSRKYLTQELDELKQYNTLIELNCINKKKLIKTKLNNLQQDVQLRTDKLLEKIQFEKYTSIDAAKNKHLEMVSKLKDAESQETLIENQLIDLRNKYENNSNSIDLNELKSIEDLIEMNLKQLENLNFITKNEETLSVKRRYSEVESLQYESKKFILKGHLNTVNAMVLDDDNIASAANDNTIRIWSVESGLTIRVLSGHEHGVTCLAVLKNGCLASGSRDRTIRLWDWTKTGHLLKILNGHTHWIRSLTVLFDGTLVSGSEDKTMQFWDVENGRTIKIFNSHNSSVECLAVLSENKLIAGFWDNTVRIIDSVNLRETLVLYGHTHRVSCLAVLNDLTLASGSYDKTIRIWDLKVGCTLKILNGNNGIVLSIVSLSNGCLASCGEYVKIWDTNTGETKKVLNGHEKRVKCLIALKNGGLASGSYDRSILIYP